MTWFCTECEKIVPDSEVKDPFNLGRLSHVYVTEENYYKNQTAGRIGYCPVQHTVFCGSVREPTDQEYFICNLTEANDK